MVTAMAPASRLTVLAAAAAALGLAALLTIGGHGTDGTDTSPDPLTHHTFAPITEPALSPECDHDGRCHPCGVITPDGVTEYLTDYALRCGR